MFGIGMPELLLIMAIALIVIGPKKLPDLAKALGRALGEFKKATSDLKDSMEIDNPIRDLKQSYNNLNKDLKKNIAKAALGDATEKKETSPGVVIPPEPYLAEPGSSAEKPQTGKDEKPGDVEKGESAGTLETGEKIQAGPDLAGPDVAEPGDRRSSPAETLAEKPAGRNEKNDSASKV